MSERSGQRGTRGPPRGGGGRAPEDDERTAHDGDDASFDDTTEPPDLTPAPRAAREVPSLGGAFVMDMDDGESTRGDPPDVPAFDDATAPQPLGDVGSSPTARSGRGKGSTAPATSVQIDAVLGDRVPAIVVRRSAAELVDPASRVMKATAVASPVDLERMMGRALGSPAQMPTDLGGRRSPLPPGDPASNRSQPPRSPPAEASPPRDAVVRGAIPAPELTQINAAAALGIAPEPALPPSPRAPAALGGVSDRPPPPEHIDLSPLARAGSELAARRPLAMPAAALRGHQRGSGAIAFAWVIVLSAALMVVVVAVRDRAGASQAPAASVARALAVAHVAMPPGERGIRLITRPPRSRIVVDGRDLGRAPLLLRRTDPRPQYELQVTAPGYKAWRGQLHLEGERVALSPEASSSGASEVATDEDGPSLVIALDHE